MSALETTRRRRLSPLSASAFSFLQCDDMSECTTKGLSKTLVASHQGIVTDSDGFCVGIFDKKTGFSIKVKAVPLLEGINILSGDGSED